MPEVKIRRKTHLAMAGVFGAVTAGMAIPATANDPFRIDREPPPLVNDFGGIGLIQTPTARSAADGQMYAGFSTAWPYRRYYVTLQGLSWLEATLRYTDVRNVLYSEFPEFSGDQTLKDRGIDLKIRLLQETQSLPALAVGLRDIAGTGLFQSEYIVASKSVGPLDLSFGMAWGNLGSRGDLKNPLRYLSSRFDRRAGASGLGGEIGSDYFKGERVGLFGGVAYRMPLDGLTLFAEYDGNSYERELGGVLPTKSPVNVGIAYQPWDWLQLGAGWERGNRLMLRFAATTNFNEPSRVPKTDTPAPPILPRSAQPTPVPAAAEAPPAVTASPDMDRSPVLQSDAQSAADSVRQHLATQAVLEGVYLRDLLADGSGLTVTVVGTPLRDPMTVAHALADRAATAGIAGRFTVIHAEDGQERIRVSFDLATLKGLGPVGAQEQLAHLPEAHGEVPVRLDALHHGPSEEVQRELIRVMGTQGIFLYAADYQPHRATLYVAQSRYRQTPRAIGRAARAAAAVLPPEYEEFVLVLVEGGVETIAVSLLRRDLEGALSSDRGSLEELWMSARFSEPPFGQHEASHPNPGASNYPAFRWALRPGLRQTLGRPEAFVLYQLWARLHGTMQISQYLSASGSIGVNIYNNFDRLTIPSDSQLPRVRSDIAEYLREGTTALTHLQLDYSFPITEGWYGHVYGGLLEEMFGGVGGEILYRPFNRNWAIGLDVAWAKQRDFDQRFSFRDYDVITGHLAGYYHYEPMDMDFRLRVGRYLAGDVGATLEVSRTFDSGITVGAFASKTDVSAEQFGEGSFDKGIYIVIPLDQLYIKSVRGAISWLWRPLTRDGAQTLVNRRPLISTTGARSMAHMRRDWDAVLE